MERSLILLSNLFFVGITLAQNTVSIEVQLSKPKEGGMVMAALCPNAEAFKTGDESGCKLMEIKADGKMVELVYTGLEPGTYALKIFQDLDGDKKLGTNKLGIPKEPFGFSNDAMGSFGPPSFEDASFQVGKEATSIKVRMRN